MYMFKKAELAADDPAPFGAVKTAIETVFAPDRIADFLRSVEAAELRVRDFASTLSKGLLGAATAQEYGQLGASDQGQLREIYLSSLERVAPELRKKFFKLYAYY
ncbi:MAG: hypothetical protein ABI158_03695 [Edaphobacter sp.]